MQGWIDIPVGLRHARVGLKFDLNIRKPFKKTQNIPSTVLHVRRNILLRYCA